jgi:hypothetical protein
MAIRPHHPGMDRRRLLLTWLVGAFVARVADGTQQGQMLRVRVKLWMVCNRP